MDADAGLHALDHIGQRAQHFGAVELVEGGLIYGGLTRGALIASVPARSGLTGDRPTAGTLPADGLT